MNIFRPRSWKQITAVGSRFYRAKEVESNVPHIPNEFEVEFEKAKWASDYNEKEITFSKLYNAFKRRKDDEPRTMLLIDDFKYDNFRFWLKRTHKANEVDTQKYMTERHETLGNELAAAHFIVYRGGRIKFYGQDYWIKTEKGEDYYENLPRQFDPAIFLEAVDAEGVKLFYEGLENLKGLARLRWLSLNGSPLIDDWCLDRIAGELRDNLEYLDISNCKKVTHRGMSCLYKMEKLKTLKVENTADSLEFQLACLMLEDANPNLSIEGVKYMAPEQNDSEIQ